MGNEFTVKFWGVRGSHPVSNANQIRYGGNTSAIEIRVNGEIILIDAGTGIINLGKDLIKKAVQSEESLNITLLLSHLHHDHIQGFPFFAPAFVPSNQISIFGPDIYTRPVKDVLSSILQPPKFPLRLADLAAQIRIDDLSAHEKLLLNRTNHDLIKVRSINSSAKTDDQVQVTALRSYAHPNGVFFYRIEHAGRSVVYANDTEGYLGGDQRLISFAEGADLLIHDTQYTEAHYLGMGKHHRSTQGFGHSTPEMASSVAQKANVQQLALIHFEPSYDDETVTQLGNTAQEGFPSSIAAYEGLEIDLLESDKLIPESDLLRLQNAPQHN